MSNPEIEKYIALLKDRDDRIRMNAVTALGKIGDVSAVPAIIETLNDAYSNVRKMAIDALGEMGDVSAVPALMMLMKDKDYEVRRYAGVALGKMGDSLALPRKILARSGYSTQTRIDVLYALRHIRYKIYSRTLRFTFPDTRTLCQKVLNEDDDEARAGARKVLDWLNGDQHLLRASQPNDATESQELLRPVESAAPETQSETLLRAANQPETESRRTLLQKLLGKNR